ncbi:MAG: sugar ABC transporter permease [Chloroflexi bacterium]|nr:sugar ABC transporter permease [Chloroflexota bacterium]MDA0246119.1 sugar ABC transporter permease [Chloroflexota bacterium]
MSKQNTPHVPPTSLISSKRNQHLVWRVVQYTVAVLVIAYCVFPIVWIFSASIDPRNSLQTAQLIPPNASFRNYEFLLTNTTQPYLRWMLNSIKVSSIASVLSVFITALSAYAFSRFRFAGRRTLLLVTFLLQVFPSSLMIVAMFLLLKDFGDVVPALGLNSHAGLILVYLGGVLGINVWLMKGILDTVPRALDESAKIDGATDWQIFWLVILPLIRPIMIIIAILTFVGTWADFLLPQILLQDTQQFTLAVGLIIFARQQFAQNWGVFSAGALMGAVPTIIIYLLVQDYIVSGLTSGAVKGE